MSLFFLSFFSYLYSFLIHNQFILSSHNISSAFHLFFVFSFSFSLSRNSVPSLKFTRRFLFLEFAILIRLPLSLPRDFKINIFYFLLLIFFLLPHSLRYLFFVLFFSLSNSLCYATYILLYPNHISKV